MGNPLQTIPNLPPAIGLDGTEQFWINQAGVDRRTTIASILASGGAGSSGSILTVNSYDLLRAIAVGPAITAVVLNDPWKGGVFVRVTTGNLTDNGGTRIVDAAGATWKRLYAERVSAAWFYNAATGYLGDGSNRAITSADQAANPQWIGLPAALGGGNYPVGTTWASVTLMEAVYCCFADAARPGIVVWNASTSSKNQALWLPPGFMPINQPFYLSARGVDIMFAAKAASLLQWQGLNSVTPVQFDAISYGAIRNLSLSDQVGVTGVPLVDVNWTGANPGLKTQQLTFYDWEVAGNNQGDSVGVYISRHGGDAQGDTVNLMNPLIFGCATGLVCGGTNTLNVNVWGGNIQNNVKYGAVAYGGSFMLYSMSMEVGAVDFHVYPQASQMTLDGADAVAFPGGGATARCAIHDHRSENVILMLDRNHAGRIDSAGVAQVFGLYGWGSGAHQHIGMCIRTGGVTNGVAICVDDSGPAWFAADASSTNTVIVKQGASPGWAPGQWVGFSRWFRYSNGFSFAGGPITASTANSLTDPNGWYSPEPFPGFVPGQLAGYYVKVTGVSGAVQPNWDSFPPGQSVTLIGSPGYGFTTGAGSNVVSTLQGVANGQGIVVCDAYRLQAPPSSTTIGEGALIGRVANLTPGALFTASVTAGVMTVTAITSGTIRIGAALNPGGISPVWSGTLVLSQISGTPGGAGTYSVSYPQQPNVASSPFGTAPSFQVVNSLGEALAATVSLTDANGYYGALIPDGQISWLPLDFDVIAGVASGDNVSPGSVGRFRECGLINYAWGMGTGWNSRIRPPPNSTSFQNFSFRNGNTLTQSLAANLTTTAATSIIQAQIAQASHAVLGNAIAAFTLNMPTWMDGLTQEFRLIINNQNAAGVMTWGANVHSVNPTVTLGAAGKVTIVTLTWVGSPAGAGVWYAGNPQGPF
jgi:hypothetical protein